MDEKKMINKLYNTLAEYQHQKYPLDLTEPEVDLLMRVLMSKQAIIEYIERHNDDGR